MIVLQAKNLGKSFGVQTIFQNISFILETGEKVGLIGPNGTGKSTLLRCLTGQEIADSGEIYISEKTTLGFLAQDMDLTDDVVLFDELLAGFADVLEDRQTLAELEQGMAMATGDRLQELMQQYAQVTERYERAGGYACETQVKKVAKGLGFRDEELSQPVATMSGGQKTRAALAKVLLIEPDILLLDEPTNHLDIQAVEWLEEFILQYPKTVLIVSHDRYFLNRTVSRLLEMEYGKITSYRENYQGYLRLKGENMESWRRAYQKQSQAIAKTEEFIRRYKAGVKSKQARGRETVLSRMEKIDKPLEQRALQARELVPVPESGFIVLDLVQLGHRYGRRQIFQHLNVTITRGEKVALVGSNGCGKTTILKSVAGEIEPSQGEIKIGSRVKIGYFSQEHETLDRRNTVLREIMFSFDKGEEESRTLLGSFLFRGDDVGKKIADLSGGERSRLALLKLLLTGANFLVLDEPTNHLDIPAKEVIEDFLGDFPGTILVVSHDRYFLDNVVDRVLEMADGQLTDYPGNYSYYRFKKKEAQTAEVKERENTKQTNSRLANPEKEKEKALKKITRQLQESEKQLEELERCKAAVALRLNDPAIYAADGAAREILAEFQALEAEIHRCYADWEAQLEMQEQLQLD